MSGYDPLHFQSLVSVEDEHFWFRVRNRLISNFAKQLVSNLPPGYRVLEIGCGNGNVLRFLEDVCRDGIVVGMDLYAEGLAFARTRTKCHLVQGDLSHPPFRRAFKFIGAFDVLEHISDDSQILTDLWKLLDHDGVLLLTVPARRRLWSQFDEVSGHSRRYEKEELRIKLERAAYKIDYMSEYMASLYPLMWLGRKFLSRPKTKTSGSENLLHDEIRVVPLLNGLLLRFLSLELIRLSKRKQFPFGTSLIAVARKVPQEESKYEISNSF